MPVGNDVVDLRDPDNRPAALHPRFDTRVFGPDELDALAAAPDADARHRLRWTMWAAKESALKYLRQVDPALPFHPREFTVRFHSSASGRVTHRGTEFGVTFDVTPARVHAATAGASTGITRTKSPAEASAEVRRLAAHEIACLLGVRPATIEIDGSAGSTPRAHCGGEVLPVDLSLSHDGTWLAWAVVLSCQEVGARRSGPGARISGAVQPVPARGRA